MFIQKSIRKNTLSFTHHLRFGESKFISSMIAGIFGRRGEQSKHEDYNLEESNSCIVSSGIRQTWT